MLKRHWAFWVILCLFVLLLAKNPFSTRTLIPNFEPYPDTIHYINSAQSFIQGRGLQIWREGRELKTTVPPLYSLILIPIFLVNNDARMFYFVNVFLAIASFILFYLIIRKLITNNYLLITFVSLFLYVTNYFIYWYPSLVMAENLTLFLFMGAIYLLLLPVTQKNVILAALISIAFYITKYASIPLTFFYFISYLLKIYLSFRTKRSKSEKSSEAFMMFICIAIAGTSFLVYSLWEWQAKGPLKPSALIGSGFWFSLQYLPTHLPEYLKAMMGGYSVRFLWDNTPIVPIFVGIPGLLGLIFGIFKKQTRILSIALLSILLSSILFMSTFYSIDMRYLYHAIPTLLIGFVMFLNIALSFRPTWRNLLNGIIIVVFLFSFAISAIRLKKQIMLNLKYAETPWYYLSVVKLNEYFVTLPKKENKPIVISSLISYYIDFFSNKTYDLLPLSLEQEFRNNRKEAWGNNDYSDLLALYKSFLNRGYDVYVHNYGLGNEKKLQNDHDAIHTYFKTTLVSTGCLGACNIWKVNIRP